MLSWPNDATRDFEDVRTDLEKALSRLKASLDPKARKRLLRELRLLIEEADCLVKTGPK